MQFEFTLRLESAIDREGFLQMISYLVTCFLWQVICLTLCCLLLSLLLCTPLMLVTKLEIRQNMVTNKSTSYCYEVKIETIQLFNVKLIL